MTAADIANPSAWCCYIHHQTHDPVRDKLAARTLKATGGVPLIATVALLAIADISKGKGSAAQLSNKAGRAIALSTMDALVSRKLVRQCDEVRGLIHKIGKSRSVRTWAITDEGRAAAVTIHANITALIKRLTTPKP